MHIKTIMTRFLLLAVVLLTAACATKNPAPTAWISKNIQVSLPKPHRATALHTQQLLSTTVDDKTHSLIVLLDADKDQIALVGLSPLGIRLFKATYDQKGIRSEQSIPFVKLPPASQVLADIMLANWPIATWQGHLPENWTLEDKENKRYLKDEQQNLIIEISYQTKDTVRSPIAIVHHVFGYSIQLEDMSENTDDNS